MELRKKLKDLFKVKHIHTKYSIQILFIIFLVTILLTLFSLIRFRKGMKMVSASVEQLTDEALYEQMERKAEVVITTLAKDLIDPVYYLDIETITDLFTTIRDQRDTIYVYLYDVDGKIISDGTEETPLLHKVLTDEVSKKAVASEKFLLQRKGDVLDASMPIYIEDEKLGGARIGFSLEKIKADILRQKKAIGSITKKNMKSTLVTSMIISGIFILLGIIFALKIAQLLVRPILKLINVTRKVGKGDLTAKVEIKSGDELEEMANSFNQMTEDLYNLHQEEKEMAKKIAVAEERARYATILEEKNQQLETAYQELKSAQRQLIQSEKMATVGTLAGGMAHEINTPLGTILTNTEMLLREVKNKEQGASLKLIEGATNRCRDIVRFLLKYSRQAPVEFQPVELNKVIDDVCFLLEYQLSNDGITINKKYGVLPKIEGNVNELEQVITNVILNSKDAIIKTYNEKKGEGNIQIRAYQKENSLFIESQDDGCGIPQKDIDKIFDPFFTTKDIGKGTGLGLSVSQRIIERHNGKIKVESEPGQGTTVRIELPIKED
ncbi:Sensor histidine kinase RcsC [subsurface metagenome]|nr:HAMP domain-containing protein [Clostridia bacterium]